MTLTIQEEMIYELRKMKLSAMAEELERQFNDPNADLDSFVNVKSTPYRNRI